MSVYLCLFTMSLSMFYKNVLTSLFSLFLSLETNELIEISIDHKVVILKF